MFCYWTILDSVIICMPSIQWVDQVKDTTDTQKAVSYIGLHLKIDNGGRLKTLRQTWWHHFLLAVGILPAPAK
jgi:hypothetical protein